MITKEDAITQLTRKLDQIDGLKSSSPCSFEFNSWHEETENLIELIFGEDNGFIEDFQAIYFTPLFLSCRTNDTTFTKAFQGGLDEACSLLNFMIAELE
jgi:hypothetical protein